MGNVVVAEGGYEVVRMVIPLGWVVSKAPFFIMEEILNDQTHLLVSQRQPAERGILDSLLKVLGQQLFLLVEVVAGADVDERIEVALPPVGL